MGVVRRLVAKDLQRRVRAPFAPLLTLAFPLVFAGLLALTFGTGDAPRRPRLELYVEDADGSFVSGLLLSALRSEQASEFLLVHAVPAGAPNPIEEGRGAALLRIPENFGIDLLEGRATRLELVRNPAQGIFPEVAEQGARLLAEGLDAASHALREPLDELASWEGAGDGPSEAQVLALSARIYAAVQSAERYLFPPVLKLETTTVSDAVGTRTDDDGFGSVFLVVLPGISVWALFLVGDLGMRDLMTESKAGTLRRQLSTPAGAVRIVVGKALYAAVLSGAGLLVLAAVAAAFVRRPVDPAAFVALSAALVLATVGFSAAVYALARTERQGATLNSVLLLTFAFLGGSFVPLSSMPDALRRLAPATPFYWGTDGFGRMLRDGAGLGDLLPNVAVLAVLGAGLLALGARLLRRRLLRGGMA